jgi:hypothetical protein
LPKRVTPSVLIGERGVALINRRTLEMGFVWHQRQVDAGIDGSIEIREPTTGVVTNRILLVQSKASNAPFANESAEGFDYVCKEEDLRYWLSGNAPVILVCSHPDTQEAWWISVKDHFANPDVRASRRAHFRKREDVFDASAAQRLADLATSTGPNIYLGPPQVDETLTSNLLRLHGYPDTIYVANSDVVDRAEGRDVLKAAGHPRSDWTLRSKRITSFGSLDRAPLSLLVRNAPEAVPSSDWFSSSDRETQKALAHLLNNTLQEQLHSELDWNNYRRYFYFRATQDLSPKKIYSASSVGRTVFRGYYPRKDDPKKFAFYRHSALRRRWQQVEDLWFLELNPTYHFTFDGRRESRYAADYLSEIKRKEGHAAVRSDLFAWAKYLQDSGRRLGDESPLRFGRLLDFSVSSGIWDRAWRKPEEALMDEAEDDAGERLF